jgi:hypothetical protein
MSLTVATLQIRGLTKTSHSFSPAMGQRSASARGLRYRRRISFAILGTHTRRMISGRVVAPTWASPLLSSISVGSRQEGRRKTLGRRDAETRGTRIRHFHRVSASLFPRVFLLLPTASCPLPTDLPRLGSNRLLILAAVASRLRSHKLRWWARH